MPVSQCDKGHKAKFTSKRTFKGIVIKLRCVIPCRMWLVRPHPSVLVTAGPDGATRPGATARTEACELCDILCPIIRDVA